VTGDFKAQAPDDQTAATIGAPIVRITPASGGQAPPNAPEPPGVRAVPAAGSPASSGRAGPAPDIRATVTAVDAALLRVQALSVAGEPAAPEAASHDGGPSLTPADESVTPEAAPLDVPVLPAPGERIASAAAPIDRVVPMSGERAAAAPSELGTRGGDQAPHNRAASDAAPNGGPVAPVSGDATSTGATPPARDPLNPAPGGPAPTDPEPRGDVAAVAPGRAAGIEAPPAETIEGRQEPSPAAGIASAPRDGDRSSSARGDQASSEGTSRGAPAVLTPEDRAVSDVALRSDDQVVPVPDHLSPSDAAHRGDRVVPVTGDPTSPDAAFSERPVAPVSGDATSTGASPPMGDRLNPVPGGPAPTNLEPRGDGGPVAPDRPVGIEDPLTGPIEGWQEPSPAAGNVAGRSWGMVLDRSKVALAAALVGLIAWRIARRGSRTDREPVRKGRGVILITGILNSARRDHSTGVGSCA
jgi:hypothetical protein